MAARERLARLLAGTGVLDAALRLRARARVPYLTILTYHHVADPGPDYAFDPGVADVTPAQFRRQLEVLRRHFHVIGIDELCGALDGQPLPPNPALITFDDAYRSCLDTALPILDDLDLRAVFFVATSFVDERRLFWWERIAWLMGQARRAGVTRVEVAYPAPATHDPRDPGAAGVLVKVVKNTRGLDVDRFLDELTAACGVTWSRDLERELTDGLLLTWDGIRALRDAGMDIESHTRRHRVLQTLDDEALRDELSGSRDDLARELGRAPRTVAYPVGRSIAAHAQIRAAVHAAGYRVGFSNASGATWLRPGIDPFDIGRLAMDRELPDAMFFGQLAIPQLGYRSASHGVGDPVS
ncbi:MAG: polysaccharide deacetylase family protein [Kofleriaceae bacterium]|nr:polysaccharide deacetylase family protein [Myxococcales bacterium]MCB9574085.1 polysaccharide deacetylase family protein [Kofleriaceae bacterium]